MRDELAKLRDEFNRAAHSGGPMPLYDATVLEVDSDAYTCDVELDGLPFYNVRLRSVVSNNKSIDVLPAVGSAVVIGMLADDDMILIAADKISSWRVSVGGVELSATDSGIHVAKGGETLEKILTDLVKAVMSIAAAKDVPTLTQLLIRIKDLLK